MKNNYLFTLILLAMLLLAQSSCSRDAHSEPVITAQRSEEDHNHEEEHESHLHKEDLESFGVVFDTAGPGTVHKTIQLPASVEINQDRIAHVVPRLSGIAVEVLVNYGETVRKGQILARISSLDMATAKSGYLSAIQTLGLENLHLEREETLYKDGITSEQEYLEARNDAEKARISVREATEILHAYGLRGSEIEAIKPAADNGLATFALYAPVSGVVTLKHITLGEHVHNDDPAFVITDLSTVWISISIPQRDLNRISTGQKVEVIASDGSRSTAEISFIDPDINRETRTATARIVLNNGQNLKPGSFVEVLVPLSEEEGAVVIPNSAITQIDGKPTVFILHGKEIQERHIELGAQDQNSAVVRGGLTPGEIYATKGAFLIKSELQKNSFGDGHNH